MAYAAHRANSATARAAWIEPERPRGTIGLVRADRGVDQFRDRAGGVGLNPSEPSSAPCPARLEFRDRAGGVD